MAHGWTSIRPDLDHRPMALFARCNRLVSMGLRSLDSALSEHGLTVGDFDVLSALRRSGQPFTLRPSELAERLMVTRAGVTSRIDRLAERGLVVRRRDPEDRRSEPIALTDVGRQMIEGTLSDFLEAEANLFGALTENQQRQLESVLRKLG